MVVARDGSFTLQVVNKHHVLSISETGCLDFPFMIISGFKLRNFVVGLKF